MAKYSRKRISVWERWACVSAPMEHGNTWPDSVYFPNTQCFCLGGLAERFDG